MPAVFLCDYQSNKLQQKRINLWPDKDRLATQWPWNVEKEQPMLALKPALSKQFLAPKIGGLQRRDARQRGPCVHE